MTPQETVERALGLSKADACVVIADESSTANLRWANSTLTTNGVTRSRQLTVIATIAGSAGTAAGVVSRSGVTEDGVEALVRAAEAAARSAGPAEDARPLVSGQAPSPDWYAPPAETSFQTFSRLTPELGRAFERARGAGFRVFGFAEHDVTTTYLGSTTGLRLRADRPTGRLELNARSGELGRSAWAGVGTRDFRDVDVPALEEELSRRLGWAARRVDLPPGRYETLLPPSAVADLVVYLYWSATARAACEGRSVFSRPGGGTRIGDRLTEVPVTLRGDPRAPGMECEPFTIAYASGEEASVFDNGLPLEATNWIEDGVLRALIGSRHSAELAGIAVTPGIDNLMLSAGDDGRSLSDMIATTDRGLLLTCLWYIREVDPQTLLLTGLTRDGVYLVEGGEVVGAVNNFRFNESPVSMLSRILEVGAARPTLPREWGDYFTRTTMPPLRVADFNMSSTSQAS
jgi:predicted Zn-dependent protease